MDTLGSTASRPPIEPQREQETRLRVARALREIATLLRVSGDERFKVRAYERAAAAVEHTPHDLGTLIERRALTSLPGVGAKLAATIEELCRTGQSAQLTRLRQQFPPGTTELIDIPHLGIKKIEALHRATGITTRDELRAACEAGRLRAVPGFGPAAERRILAALTADTPREETLLLHALAATESLIDWVRRAPGVARVEVAGAVRRGQEVVDRIELVAATTDVPATLEHFLRHPHSIATVAQGSDEATIRLLSGPVVTLHATAPSAYVHALHYFTGGPGHIRKLRARAGQHGLALTPAGLVTEGGEPVLVNEEPALYARLGLPFIAPELREYTGEIAAAETGELPRRLIELADVQGITHVHTVYSDGANSIEEMATAAAQMGMRYLTITDHSPSAVYAHGVKLDQLQRQWDEIARVQERVGIRLLRGTESDILRDGALDYADELLQRFDVVIASIHSRYRMNAAQMTERVVRAMRHPVFKIWGHPLGRLLQSRPPFDCDVDAILDAIAASRAAIEINGDPHRLDLEPRWIRAARRRGIKFVLSTDAHSISSLRHIRFAVTMARRGWVTREEVLNTLPPDAFAAAVRP